MLRCSLVELELLSSLLPLASVEPLEMGLFSLLSLASVESPVIGRAGVTLVQALIERGACGVVMLVTSVLWGLLLRMGCWGAVLTSDLIAPGCSVG